MGRKALKAVVSPGNRPILRLGPQPMPTQTTNMTPALRAGAASRRPTWVARRSRRAVEVPSLSHVASGGQSVLFTQPDADWVIKVPRFSLLSVLALYAELPARMARDRVRRSLGGLVLPYTVLRGVRFTGVRVRGFWDTARPLAGTRKLYRPERTILTRRLLPTDILEEQLERGSPAKVADGLEEMLQLLEAVADRGFFLLDFVMKNFARLDGKLVIADWNLLIPLPWVRNVHFRPVSYCFRKGLLKDYARIIHNALARCGEADGEARRRLEALATEFPRRIHALAGTAPSQVGESCPVVFPAAITREVNHLLARSDS